MKSFTERTIREQEIIRKAYQFEVMAIDNDIDDINPYVKTIREMEDGEEILEAINVALELKYL